MRFPRSSGIVLHPTSLAGPFGIGDLGPEAHRFVDFLSDAGQTLWQVLPLGPTGFGDSPYQSFSSAAGNPLLISLEKLAEEGWLAARDWADAPRFPEDHVDFAVVIPWKMNLLHRAGHRFLADSAGRRLLDEFAAKHAAWLDDAALFLALKQYHGGREWTLWEEGLRDRDARTMAGFRARLAEPVMVQRFLQYQFFRQWDELRAHSRRRGVRIMGDLPIYAAHDSTEVWAHRELFHLDDEGRPTAVSGVPPDYFSADGQLWGNPIYRWDAMAADGYRWWIERLRGMLGLVDVLRLDHFRGFEAYWEVPAAERTAVNGRWVKGPGSELFQAARAELGDLPLVAENLGVITPEVEAIRARFGFPGMAVLQFAFGTDPQAPTFRPHNYPREVVAYTGTHDCDTTAGWWNSAGRGESTRSSEDIAREREFAKRYLNTDGREIHWVMIRALMASVAATVLIPMQDVLGLGSEARMNQPATLGGNWRWRMRPGMLDGADAGRLRALAATYERV